MTGPAPRIDARDRAGLVADTERLAQLLSPWRPPESGTDLGRALITLFGDLAGAVLDRLNAVPDRDFLAFLELLGAEPLPARATTVPLTFTLPAGGVATAFVPAGTPAVAPATSGGAPARFFTDRDLVLTSATLTAAVVIDPAADRRADVTAAAQGAGPPVWPPFAGDSLIEHALLVAHDDLVTLPRPRTLGVRLTFPDQPAREAFRTLPLEWSRWDGARWAPVPGDASPVGDTEWVVDLGDVPDPQPVEVAGRTARWLRARLSRAIGTVPESSRATVAAAAVTAELTAPPDAVPAAFVGAVPADLAADTYPFGEQPRFTDTFVMADPAFGRPGADAAVDVVVSAGLPVKAAPSPDLLLVWEIGGADGWVEVGRSGPAAPDPADEFVDHTTAFVRSGQVRFTVPATGGPLVLGGISGWWLRVRIAAGNYGVPATYRPAPDAAHGPVLVPPTFAPPAVSAVHVGWSFSGTEPSRALATVNGEEAEDRTGNGAPVVPFRPVAAGAPALHLGFDRAFPNRPMLLHVLADPAPPEPGAGSAPLDLRWEYAGADGWHDLAAVDETLGLTRSAPVGFLGPADLVPTRLFGRSLCWLRVHPASTGPGALPRLRRILTNTVPASAALAAPPEVLGSSDGSAGQRFRTARRPVLAGERVEVLTGQTWQEWTATGNFAASGPLDPSYVLDRERGEITFGDGRFGAAPPAGSAIRATYRSGGGAADNRPTGTITQLEVALAGVEGVVNFEPAAGGADAEPVERVRARGPLALRHGGRAVAAQDYADLAMAASPDVARALTVPPPINPLDVAWIDAVPLAPDPAAPVPDGGSVLCSASPDAVATHRPGSAGRVAVVVVPDAGDSRPVPSRQLLDEVGEVLRQRCPAVLEDGALTVVGPEWVAVTVTTVVAVAQPDGPQSLPEAVALALERFLHPLRGGPGGGGWQFGRAPHRSDLLAVVTAVPGVDHVVRLDVAENPARAGLSPEQLARTLIWSGVHAVSVVPAGGTT